MVQVQFDEGPEIAQNKRSLEGRPSGFVAWLMRKEVIKSERQGDILLISIFILCVLLSIYFFVTAFRTPVASPTGPTLVPTTAVGPR